MRKSRLSPGIGGVGCAAGSGEAAGVAAAAAGPGGLGCSDRRRERLEERIELRAPTAASAATSVGLAHLITWLQLLPHNSTF